MLTQNENNRVTLTGRGTPAGELMRRFWQPAALVDELPRDRPAVAVDLMGEKLVLFRDDKGNYGLIDRQCPHRGADLCFGRLENGGIRCPFHGWLFDVNGACLEQPAEPEDSQFYKKIHHISYPCFERSGMIFAYLGPGEPPDFPHFDCFAAPPAYTFAFKGHIEANWLQALEVGIDPSHASFLHRFFEDADDPVDGYGQQFRDSTEEIPVTKLMRENVRPEIAIENTNSGFRIFSKRDLENLGVHMRVTNLAFPNAIIIPMSNDITISQWHVPVTEVECYWYAIFTAFEEKVDKKAMRDQREELYTLPNYKPKRNRSNNWGYDPEEQKNKTFTGMGSDINVHDNWAVESPGRVFDRSKEHLGTTDKAIIAYRRMLLKAIKDVEEGKEIPFIANANSMTGPVAVDTIGSVDKSDKWWLEIDRLRRLKSPWARKI